MNKFKSLLVGILIVFTMSMSFAALPYSAQQVETAMRQRDFGNAENMLKAIIKVKPDSAKAWYMLAQCEEQLGQTVNARDYLTKAITFDPQEKFGSPGAPEAMMRRLTTVNSPAPMTRQIQQVPQVVHVVQPPAKPTDYTGLIWFLVILGMGVALFFVFKTLAVRSAKRIKQESHEAERKMLFSKAADLQTRLMGLKKTATYENKMGSVLGNSIISTLSRINSLVIELKNLKVTGDELDGLGNYKQQLNKFDTTVANYESEVVRKEWDPKPIEVAKDETGSTSATVSLGNLGLNITSDSSSNNVFRPNRRYSSSPTRTVVRETVIQQSPSVMVVNNNNDDLLTGVLIGETLESSRERNRTEIEYSRNRSSRNDDFDNSSSRVAYEPPAPSPSPSPMDFGGSSSYDSSSSSYDSGSSSFDSGSSSSDW